jgi:hypothetical protein
MGILVMVGLLGTRAQAQDQDSSGKTARSSRKRKASTATRGRSFVQVGGRKTAPIRLSLVGWKGSKEWVGKQEIGAGILLVIPWDSVALASSQKRVQRQPIREVDWNEEEEQQEAELDENEQEKPMVPQVPKPAMVTRLRASDMQRLVHAAQRTARIAPEQERLNGLGQRARWSALLPQMRLRTMRSNDQSLRLQQSYTDSDVVRSQTAGGASVFWEATATWKLNRLVFAEEEVAIERLRHQQQALRFAITKQVVEALTRWQILTYKAAQTPLSSAQQIRLESQRLGEEVKLDTLTGGEWSAMRAEQEQVSQRQFGNRKRMLPSLSKR